MSYSYPKQLKKFKRIKSVLKWWKTSDFILSPCYLIGSLHPMFTLRYRKSRDNLFSSDVKLSSRILFTHLHCLPFAIHTWLWGTMHGQINGCIDKCREKCKPWEAKWPSGRVDFSEPKGSGFESSSRQQQVVAHQHWVRWITGVVLPRWCCARLVAIACVTNNCNNCMCTAAWANSAHCQRLGMTNEQQLSTEDGQMGAE